MRRDRVSIKWRLFIYLLVFAALMLALLWVFQTVLLERLYRAIAMENVRAAARSVGEGLDQHDSQAIIDDIARQYSLCIRVTDSLGRDIYSDHAMDGCMIHRMADIELQRYYLMARRGGGTAFESFSHSVSHIAPGQGGRVTAQQTEQSILYAHLVERRNGTAAMVLINARISPVTVTMRTLRIQLLWVTGICAVLALLLALLLSRIIARPIVRISNSAKELARGNYDTVFDGRGYLEAAELSETLNYAANELGKTERLRQELIANISHDLRTPLTMIVGFGEAMRDLPGENTPENARIIVDEAKRLSLLVNDMLDLSKIQSGVQRLELTDFNLTALVGELVARCAKLAGPQGYRIDFTHDREAWVRADELKIGQVVYNLLGNAINYTGEDRRVSVSQGVEDGWVRVSVADTGEGISEEQLPFIWDRYYKGDRAHRRAPIGTGLGLSIVKGLLQLHDARFGVESTPGQGSVFWFALPVQPEPEGEG